MTQAADSTASANASATLSGRELALKRRQAMALHGKAGVARLTSGTQPAAAPRPTAHVFAPAAAPSAAAPAAPSDAALIERLRAASTKKASRARREAVSYTHLTLPTIYSV